MTTTATIIICLVSGFILGAGTCVCGFWYWLVKHELKETQEN